MAAFTVFLVLSVTHSYQVKGIVFALNRKNYAHRNNHSLQNTEEPAAPAAHTRYLSSPAAATLHGKTQGFVPRLPPQNKAHATFMQPLQCVSQHHVANLHVSTHMAAPEDNNIQQSCSHCSITSQTCTYLRTWQHQMTTIMQPFQCDLPPQIQETKRTTHTGTTTFAKHIEGTKRPQPHPPHTRGTFHHRPRPLYREKHKVSCSGFLPKTKPHATFMQPSQCILQHHVANLHVSTHHPSLSVLLCDVKSHTTLHWVYSYLMSSLTPPFIACILMWCQVSHHPSLTVFLCDVKSHTTFHWAYSYVMSSLTPPFIECIVMWCEVSHHLSLSVFLCDVKSHTTLHWVYCYVMSSLTPPFIR